MGAEKETETEQVACGATEGHWLTSAVKREGLGPAKVAARVRVVVPVLVTVTVPLPTLAGSMLLGRWLVRVSAVGFVVKDGPGPTAVPVTRMYSPVGELPVFSEILAARVPVAVGVKVTVMMQAEVPPGQELAGLGLTEVVTAETLKSPGLAPPMEKVAAGEPVMIKPCC